MTNSKLHKEETSKYFIKLKKMADDLNLACSEGKIDSDKILNYQEILNKIADRILKDAEYSNQQKYLIYEVQGLIHWVKGEKKLALDLIKSAKDLKENGLLYTQAANNLADSLKKSLEPRYLLVIFIIAALAYNGMKDVNDNNVRIIAAAIALLGDICLLMAIVGFIARKIKNKN